MDAISFRTSTVRVVRMRELLSDPIMAEAIVCLQDERPYTDAMNDADPVVSVRLLSRAYQHDQAVNLLLSLAEPLPVQVPDEAATFGAKLDELTKVPEP